MDRESRRTKRYVLAYGGLTIALLLLLFLNLRFGTVGMTGKDVWQALFAFDRTSTFGTILWNIRMPRLLAAMLLGGALSMAGYCLQTFFANPIAGPFVLGISSGAKLTVALVMIYFLQLGIAISSVTMVVAAFVGALLATGFVLLLSRRTNSMAILIVCGVMIGYICSAITDFVVTFADDSNIVNLHNWSLGSFSGTSWSQVATMAVIVVLCVIAALFLAKPMAAYQLGETYAKNMGVHIRAFRVGLILLSSILAATVTAFAGPISFVGIAVPHLTKKLFASNKPLIILTGGFLMGSVFCLLCDLIARLAFAPTELSISSVTAVFGAPVVIWIMIARRKDHA